MDLLQKHGHLKSGKSKSTAEQQENEHSHRQSQQEINNLLGNFGQPVNDHPDRRSSGAANMGSDLQKAAEMVEQRNSTTER